MTERHPSLDLPRHAADKVKRALDDVLQLTSDPGELLQIAVLAAAVPIGAASGFLAGLARAKGSPIEKADAVVAILDMLKTRLTAHGT